MKKLIITAVILCLSLVSFAQSNLDKYGDMRGVASLEMTSKMFKMLSKIDLDSSDPDMQEYIKLVEKLENIKMYTTTETDLKNQMKADVQAYLNSANLDELMRAQDGDGKNVKFYFKPGRNENFVREFLMLADGDIDGKDRTVVIRLTGDINLNQISKLAKDLKFPGSDELKEVEKN